MADTRPPHGYIPGGPAETRPEGGFQPAEVRLEAFAAVLDGVPQGAYGKRIIEWLVQLDDDTCRTVARLMWDCRVTGLPEAPEWGVRFRAGGDREHEAGSEEQARATVRSMRESDQDWDAVLLYRRPAREAGPRTEVPDGDEGDDPGA